MKSNATDITSKIKQARAALSRGNLVDHAAATTGAAAGTVASSWGPANRR